MKFVSKAVEIEASRFTQPATAPLGVRVREDGSCYVLTAHDQTVEIVPGDWIILEPGSNGTRAYPCKDEIFKSKYQPKE